MFLSAPLPWRYPQVRYRTDPVLLFALQPNQSSFTADQPVRTNARGLRGPLVAYPRTPGRIRVLVLGDSIAFGYGVGESQSVGARLGARLAARGVPAEVINSAVPSFNVEQEVAYLVTEGWRYRPDWVILAVCWNDINDKSGVRVTPEGWLATGEGKPAGGAVRLAQTPEGYALRNAIKRSRLLYAATEGLRGLRERRSPDDHSRFREDILEGRSTPRVDRGWARMEKSLAELARQARDGGFRVLVVTFPMPLALEREYPRSSYPSRVHQLASASGLPWLDLAPTFREAYRGHDSLFIPYDGDHPNARGHDRAAEAIVRVLLAAGAAPVGN